MNAYMRQNANYSVNLLSVDYYACVSFLVLHILSHIIVPMNRQADSHQPRTFCRTVRRVTFTGEVKIVKIGAEGKPSVNSAVV